jgi:hypothetical protein
MTAEFDRGHRHASWQDRALGRNDEYRSVEAVSGQGNPMRRCDVRQVREPRGAS